MCVTLCYLKRKQIGAIYRRSQFSCVEQRTTGASGGGVQQGLLPSPEAGSGSGLRQHQRAHLQPLCAQSCPLPPLAVLLARRPEVTEPGHGFVADGLRGAPAGRRVSDVQTEGRQRPASAPPSLQIRCADWYVVKVGNIHN